MKHISKFSTPILVFFLAVIGNSCSYGMKSSAADRFSKDQCEIKLSKDTDSVKLIST